MNIWRELNQQPKNFEWPRQANRQNPSRPGLSQEQTVKLELTPNADETGEPAN
jgi:hypothetical protein